MRRDTWLGIGIVVAVLAVGAVVWQVLPDDSTPEATGRSGDACAATGATGLVGLDLASGRERWTNVVGDDIQNVWTPGPDGDVTSSDSDHVYVVDGKRHVRRIVAATGAVDACPTVGGLSAAEVGRPIPVDGTGALALDQGAASVAVVEADGGPRWLRDGRHLLAASAGGVATQTDLGYRSGAPTLDVEVLEPATGELRWAKELPGLSAVATPTHLVVVDQFPSGSYPPDMGGSPSARHRARVTAYDLADGSEAWHVGVDGTPSRTFADAGLILVPGFDGAPRLTAIDEATGEVRWDVVLPEPGRGGDASEYGDIDGVAVAGDVVAVAVRSQPPYRD